MATDDEFERELEEQAQQLGLPRDPEAYQDGGVAVAATAMNLAEAETLATLLKANDVPAWVKAPLATLMVAEPQMFSVLVPLGRLADARQLIAEHPHHEAPPEEGEETADAEEVEPAREPAGEPAEPSLSGPRLAAGVILLVVGLGGLAYTVSGVATQSSTLDWVKVLVCGILSIALCDIGIRGVAAAREPKP
jgi:hypothetical protein